MKNGTMKKWMGILLAMAVFLTYAVTAWADGTNPMALKCDQIPNAVAIVGRNNDRYSNALTIEPGTVYTQDVLRSNMGFNSDCGWNTGTQWYTFTAKESGQYTLFIARDVREDSFLKFRMGFYEESRDPIARIWTNYGRQSTGLVTADLVQGRTYYIAVTSPVYYSSYPYIFTVCSPSKHAEAGGEQILREADCSHEGCMGHTCIYCGASTETTVIPANGNHQAGEAVVVKEASCAEAGVEQAACSICGEILAVREIPPTGHHFGEWTIGRMPTADEPGYQIRVCGDCGEAEIKELTLSR